MESRFNLFNNNDEDKDEDEDGLTLLIGQILPKRKDKFKGFLPNL